MANYVERDWNKTETFSPRYWKWARRARLAGPLIEERWVCDLGCGQQPLKWFLPRDAVYLPADLREWTPDTEVCDLNSGQYPLRSLLPCDTAVLLGVIAHLRDPKSVLAALSQYAEFIVLSHNPIEKFPRRAVHSISHFSHDELVALLDTYGYQVERHVWFDRQRRLILRCRKRRFSDEQRALREKARSFHSASAPLPVWQRLLHYAMTMGAG